MAKGYTQIEGIDFFEIFSLVVKFVIVRTLLALATVQGWHCKVVIYKYVFCWLLFRAKFDCNFIQSFVPCICCGNLL